MVFKKVQSNLAAILMSSTPISATILAHFFVDKEKITLFKLIGIVLGFLESFIYFQIIY